MKEPRSLYINQLINCYRKSFFDDTENYIVNYRYERDTESTYRSFGHNEGLDVIQKYIRDLEKKVDELQYVERIIELAKEN
jgi:plasmid stabilization system protein ParE